MGFADFYFSRFKQSPEFLTTAPSNKLGYCVVIPCYNEPDLSGILDSLLQCNLPGHDVEIIIVVNSPINAPNDVIQQNQATLRDINKYSLSLSQKRLKIHAIDIPDLPLKHAGAGLARKIGMDEAIRRFNTIDNPEGIIISLDADTLVENNYFTAIEQYFNSSPQSNACTIYFEHPVSGGQYPVAVYNAIIQYELYLRYVSFALRWALFPFPFYTIGSALAVRALAYVKQGGMNKRKAGEDFYFLHKLTQLGPIGEINNTCVYPSPRPSSRVPFGTGPVIKKIAAQGDKDFLVYNPEVFMILRHFFSRLNRYFNIELENFPIVKDEALESFLEKEQFKEGMAQINANCSSAQMFEKKFFQWFNGFRVVKFLNFCHENHFSKIPVRNAALYIQKELGFQIHSRGLIDLLGNFRIADKKRNDI